MTIKLGLYLNLSHFSFLLTSLVLLTLISSYRAHFDLLLYGDVGQVDEFKANPSDASKDSDLFVIKGTENSKKTCKSVTNKPLSGLKNFQNVIDKDLNGKHKYLCKADKIIMLGDHVYIENGKSRMYTEVSKDYEIWRKRMMCGLYLLREIFNKVKCPSESESSGSKLNPFSKTNQGTESTNANSNAVINPKFDKIVPIVGNHSYDIDYKEDFKFRSENFYISGTIFNNNQVLKEKELTVSELTNSPFMQIISKDYEEGIGTIKIQFLYVNPTLLYCYLFDNINLSIEQFNKCYYNNNLYGIYHSFSQVEQYTKELVLAIKSFRADVDWRVMVMHQPIFNIAGDYADNSWWYENPVDKSGKSLMDYMREYNVNIILASHHHSVQIQMFPWDQYSNLKKKFKEVKANDSLGFKQDFSLSNKACLTSECENETILAPRCYFNDKLIFGDTKSTICNIKQHMNLKYNKRKPKNLLVFIVGISGRDFDTLVSDHKIAAATLFARTIKHGGLYLKFGKSTLNAEVFEEGEKVLQFDTEFAINDYYERLDKYVETKLNGTAYGNGSEGSSNNSTDSISDESKDKIPVLNEFNYSLYKGSKFLSLGFNLGIIFGIIFMRW